MRPQEVSLDANGNSSWVQHDYYQTPPAITLAGSVSSGASLTWGVQATADDAAVTSKRQVTISQAGTVITVTDLGPTTRLGTHGLSVGDYVNLMGTSQNGVNGEFSVATVVSATQYTLTSPVNQNITLLVAFAVTCRVFAHPQLTGEVGRAQGSWAFPVRASRLVVSNWVSGVASLEVLQGALSS
jgi:hypothetical protein